MCLGFVSQVTQLLHTLQCSLSTYSPAVRNPLRGHSAGRSPAYPSHPLYNDSLSSYWSKQEQELASYCILKPESADDVSSAVLHVTQNSQKCGSERDFAIKGGSHTTWAGAANIDGVTIDLGAMNNVTVNDALTVALNGGWSQMG